METLDDFKLTEEALNEVLGGLSSEMSFADQSMEIPGCGCGCGSRNGGGGGS